LKAGRAGFGFAAMLALTPVAAVGGGMLLAPLQALVGMIAAPMPGARARTVDFLKAAGPLLLFTVWAAISVSWSTVPRPEQAIKIIGAAASGALLIAGMGAASPRDRALARAALVAALIVLCVLSAIEAGFDMPLNRIDEPPGIDPGILERNPGKGVSILVLLLWGGLAALGDGPRWRLALGAALLIATAALSLQFHMATNAVGFVAGLAAFATGWFAPRIAPMAFSALLALWLLLAPWISSLLLSIPGVAAGMPLSWRMRAMIWDFAHDRIAERPVTGWGLDGARQFGDTILTIDGLDFRAIPLHPHSFSFHVWLETGAIGASLMAAVILCGGVAASRTLGRSRAATAAVCGVMGTAGAIWNVSYGAWQEWWIAAVFVGLAAAAVARRSGEAV